MNLEKIAEEQGYDVQQLFIRAHRMYGHMWGLHGPTEAYKLWKRSGVIPIYALQYCTYLSKRVLVLNGA